MDETGCDIRCDMGDEKKEKGVPYKKLHIYYLKGRLKQNHKMFYKNFIGNWEEDDFSFLFFSRPSGCEVDNLLKTQPHLDLIDQFEMTYEEWHGGPISPFKAGNFFIVPPWEKADQNKQGRRIILDPGVVFGTGTHPTTHDCLKALELIFSREKIESVLDLGTGTGLLAVAAASLGSKNTLAVDLNFLAAKTAADNVRLNRLQDRIVVVQGRADDFIGCSADLVIANIHYDAMKTLITSEAFLNKKWFILSGLLRSQANDVACNLSKHFAKIIKKWDSNNIWHTFLGRMC